ncbi:uncharacterized protein LOC131665361 [Phymastichus coffea]|uniref:uncharacterized protein LOC131665361 n=1 Tax=Phymastichus coffea TaxID=108790 RepID=UPI00273AFA25|nr:uncharacterized protein LOC131665361 [Phymastichus coffea]
MASQYNCEPNYGKLLSPFYDDKLTDRNNVRYRSHMKHASVMSSHRKQGQCNRTIPRYHSTDHHRYANPTVPRWSFHQNKQPYLHSNNDISVVARVRAARRANFENSLFPHGDPLPEDWIDSWDERPECPRPKWTYEENPSWQLPIKYRAEEYSGTELIQARNDDVLTTSFNKLHDFFTNVRPQTWQIVSTDSPRETAVVTPPTSDYESGDSHSDSSSVKSASSSIRSPNKIFDVMW